LLRCGWDAVCCWHGRCPQASDSHLCGCSVSLLHLLVLITSFEAQFVVLIALTKITQILCTSF
jgi:hypothetical protein